MFRALSLLDSIDLVCVDSTFKPAGCVLSFARVRRLRQLQPFGVQSNNRFRSSFLTGQDPRRGWSAVSVGADAG